MSNGQEILLDNGITGTITTNIPSGRNARIRPASTTTLGGIKVGDGLEIISDGRLSVTPVTLEELQALNVIIDADYTHIDNNFTTELLNKLNAIEAGAEQNVQSDWNAAEGNAFILNKPTKLSDFENDEGFIDNTVNNLTNYYKSSDTYTKIEVDSLVNAISSIEIEVVSTLPLTGESNKIYLVDKPGDGPSANSFYEYVWVASTTSFEKIGDTEVNLANYLQTTGNASSTTVGFSASGIRVLPATGETLATVIGKIVKYLTDLKAAAFTGNYNDLTNVPAFVKVATGTISTIQTSATIPYTGTYQNCTIIDSATKEIVYADVIVNNSNIEISVAENPTSALNISIFYI